MGNKSTWYRREFNDCRTNRRANGPLYNVCSPENIIIRQEGGKKLQARGSGFVGLEFCSEKLLDGDRQD